MAGKNTHLQVISQQNTQNPAKLPLQTCEKNHNNFANSGSFAKDSVPVHICNPLLSFSILLIAVFLNEKIPPIVLHDL